MSGIKLERPGNQSLIEQINYDKQLERRGIVDKNHDNVIDEADEVPSKLMQKLRAAAKADPNGMSDSLAPAEILKMPIKRGLFERFLIMLGFDPKEESATEAVDQAANSLAKANHKLAQLKHGLETFSGEELATKLTDTVAFFNDTADLLEDASTRDNIGLADPASVRRLKAAMVQAGTLLKAFPSHDAAKKADVDSWNILTQWEFSQLPDSLKDIQNSIQKLQVTTFPISAEGGAWEAKNEWSADSREEFTKFRKSYLMAHTKEDGTIPDNGALSSEMMVAWARHKSLPITSKELGGIESPDINATTNPLQSINEVIVPITDKEAATVRTFHYQNWEKRAVDEHMDCLTTFNQAVRLLMDDPSIKVSSTVDLTVKALQEQGLAGRTLGIDYNDKSGRPTGGVTAPIDYRPGQSITASARELAGEIPSWHFFGFSLMDGNHTIMLVMDNRDPSEPVYYWADQWASNEGWKAMTAEDFDARALESETRWWQTKADDPDHPVKFKTQSRVTKIHLPNLNLPGIQTPNTGVATVTPGTAFNENADS